jgi:hypothetical protein
MTARLHHRASSAASMFHESEFHIKSILPGWVRAKILQLASDPWWLSVHDPDHCSFQSGACVVWIMWMSVSSFP